VLGWNKDDLTEREFWQLADAILRHGRDEIWTAPAGFYDSGRRPQMRNTYLYVDGYAYWFTRPRNSVPMLNRELISFQETARTRQVADNDVDQTVSIDDDVERRQLRLEID
jgi:hypothetical protein